jgi:hypothetical protein
LDLAFSRAQRDHVRRRNRAPLPTASRSSPRMV